MELPAHRERGHEGVEPSRDGPGLVGPEPLAGRPGDDCALVVAALARRHRAADRLESRLRGRVVHQGREVVVESLVLRPWHWASTPFRAALRKASHFSRLCGK